MASDRSLTVRLATHADLGALIGCALAFPDYDVQAEAVEPLFVASIAVGACYMATVDDHAIGFVVGLVLPHPFSGRPYLDVIAWWVLPEWRRRSSAGLRLGRKMLRFQWTDDLEMVKIATADARIGAWLHRQGFRAVETTWIRGAAWRQFHFSSAGASRSRPTS